MKHPAKRWTTLLIVSIVIGTIGCAQNDVVRDTKSRVETKEQLIQAVVFFEDFHLGKDESVLVHGEEIIVTDSLEPMFDRLLKLQPSVVVVGTSKKPHPALASRIRSLQDFCYRECIELDLSADELFFVRGGKVDFKGTGP
jgi:hypothetical protein